jgi:UDP-glucuronate 4-epimerase
MNVLITGEAGFIGFHLAKLLLSEGFKVHGYDGLTDYYDVSLKLNRRKLLFKFANFTATTGMLEDYDKLEKTVNGFKPDIIIHLAAQAGVRYSLENPRSYINSNIVGTFNVMETARKHKINHLMMASSSSIYGANLDMPFNEKDKADTQLTIYSATKKANESMAHAYSYLWKIPTTMFRFFTVYGPWGRPDMALFKFVSNIIESKPIDVFNRGEMYRDFTYVEDLVKSIYLLIKKIPTDTSSITNHNKLSVAPFRIINIGNSSKVKLLDFIEAIEDVIGKKAIKRYLPMQKGDVLATYADTSLFRELIGHSYQTNIKHGVKSFVNWYRNYYDI